MHTIVSLTPKRYVYILIQQYKYIYTLGNGSAPNKYRSISSSKIDLFKGDFEVHFHWIIMTKLVNNDQEINFVVDWKLKGVKWSAISLIQFLVLVSDRDNKGDIAKQWKLWFCFTKWRKIQWFPWHAHNKSCLIYLWPATTCIERLLRRAVALDRFHCIKAYIQSEQTKNIATSKMLRNHF